MMHFLLNLLKIVVKVHQLDFIMYKMLVIIFFIYSGYMSSVPSIENLFIKSRTFRTRFVLHCAICPTVCAMFLSKLLQKTSLLYICLMPSREARLGYTKHLTIHTSIKVTQTGTRLVFFSPLAHNSILTKIALKLCISK